MVVGAGLALDRLEYFTILAQRSERFVLRDDRHDVAMAVMELRLRAGDGDAHASIVSRILHVGQRENALPFEMLAELLEPVGEAIGCDLLDRLTIFHWYGFAILEFDQ